MLKRLNWLEGLKSAAFMAAIQFILASGSYLTGCGIFRTHPCSVEIGIKWISAHPVFPNLAPIMILLGFVVGLFVAARVDVEKIASDPQSADVRAGERWQFKFLLILIAPLILSFALWGLPELMRLYFSPAQSFD